MTEVPYIAAVTAALLGLSRAEDGRTAFLAGLLACWRSSPGLRGHLPARRPALLPAAAMADPQRLIACLAYILPCSSPSWPGRVHRACPRQPAARLDHHPVRQWRRDARWPAAFAHGVAQRLYWHELRYPAHFLLPLMPLEWARSMTSRRVSLLLLAIIGYGWLVLFRRRRGALECWLPLALAFLLVPRVGAARYWLPFLPFLFYYLLHGLHEIGQRLPRLAGLARALPIRCCCWSAAPWPGIWPP